MGNTNRIEVSDPGAEVVEAWMEGDVLVICSRGDWVGAGHVYLCPDEVRRLILYWNAEITKRQMGQ